MINKGGSSIPSRFTYTVKDGKKKIISRVQQSCSVKKEKRIQFYRGFSILSEVSTVKKELLQLAKLFYEAETETDVYLLGSPQ